jgi:hypothetical protein
MKLAHQARWPRWTASMNKRIRGIAPYHQGQQFHVSLPLRSSARAVEMSGARGYLRFFRFASSSIPTQVVDPSVSLAAVLQGTGLTSTVEPSGAATSKPGVPSSARGSGPVEYGVGRVPAGL